MIKRIIHLRDLTKYNYIGLRLTNEKTKEIKRELIKKFGNLKIAAKELSINHVTLYRMKNLCTRIYIWRKILTALNLNFEDIETSVVSLADKKIYRITFPIACSPLMIRLASHVVGDGSFATGYSARWIQKDTSPLKNLQESLLGNSGKIIKYQNAEHITIMNLYIKLACVMLNTETKDIGTYRFIEACIKLPKEYKLQVFAAIVEDEGSIMPKSCSFKIGIKDKNLLKSIKRLAHSLDYQNSEIIKSLNHGFNNNKLHYIHSLHIYILGAHKFYRDLEEAKIRFGKFAGLWTKEKNLGELVSKNKGNFALGALRNEKLIEKTLKIIRQNNNIMRWKYLRRELNISHQELNSLLRRMQDKSLIEKTNTWGNYKIKG